jgi:hypothetical protein
MAVHSISHPVLHLIQKNVEVMPIFTWLWVKTQWFHMVNISESQNIVPINLTE